jgi:hypothetical protein
MSHLRGSRDLLTLPGGVKCCKYSIRGGSSVARYTHITRSWSIGGQFWSFGLSHGSNTFALSQAESSILEDNIYPDGALGAIH